MREQICVESHEKQLSKEAEKAFDAMFARYQQWIDHLVLCTPRLINNFVISAAKTCVAEQTAPEDLAAATKRLADYLRLHHL